MADFTFILGPEHVHGTRTPEEFEKAQRKFLSALHQSGRSMAPAEPVAAVDGVTAYINGGRWMLMCPCGSGVSVSVKWDIGRCFECGSVYQHLVFPEPEIRAAIEQLLVKRPRHARNWKAPATLEELIQEDIAESERT